MDDLQARLEAGVVAVGLADDNCTELFDVEGANELMHEAASALAEAQAEIAALSQDIEGLQYVTSVVENPDRQLCCSGYECGCQGATVGQYAAWALRDRPDRINSAALAVLTTDTCDHPEPENNYAQD